MRQYETYKCQKCGNEVEVQNVGGGKLSCCGEEMKCITTDLTAVNLMKAFAGVLFLIPCHSRPFF